MDYKKILEGVVNIINTAEKSDIGFANICAYISENCPELKESEDERIRKELVYFVKSRLAGFPQCEKFIAWLEKQGEQKSIDKVEQKFKVGDWVMLDRPVLITRVEDMPYNTHQYWTSDGTWFGDATKAKLWTIQNAKDGDVLVASDGSIFLFAGLYDCACKYYVALTTNNDVKINKTKSGFWETSRAVYPATKEQCDLLFSKMKEARYEWDSEKKEPKKIEQKTAWSEEDVFKVQRICKYLNEAKKYYADITEVRECMDWLKSLKDRYTWKPSDEQIKVCKEVYADILSAKGFDLGTVNSELNRLEEQLRN